METLKNQHWGIQPKHLCQKKIVNHKFHSIHHSEIHTIKECPHILHFPHLIIRWSSPLTNYIKYLLTKTFFDIWVFRQHVEGER